MWYGTQKIIQLWTNGDPTIVTIQKKVDMDKVKHMNIGKNGFDLIVYVTAPKNKEMEKIEIPENIGRFTMNRHQGLVRNFTITEIQQIDCG